MFCLHVCLYHLHAWCLRMPEEGIWFLDSASFHQVFLWHWQSRAFSHLKHLSPTSVPSTHEGLPAILASVGRDRIPKQADLGIFANVNHRPLMRVQTCMHISHMKRGLWQKSTVSLCSFYVLFCLLNKWCYLLGDVLSHEHTGFELVIKMHLRVCWFLF